MQLCKIAAMHISMIDLQVSYVCLVRIVGERGGGWLAYVHKFTLFFVLFFSHGDESRRQKQVL